MLVLTRKLNESIIIDGDIEIVVVAIHGNKVRLGFKAAPNVTIQRSETADRGSSGQTTPPASETSRTENLVDGVIQKHNIHGGG